jgi:hypothetical protein
MAEADTATDAVAEELAAVLEPLSVAHDDTSVFDGASTPAKTLSLEIVVSGARLPRRKGDTDAKFLQKVCLKSDSWLCAAPRLFGHTRCTCEAAL